MERTCRREVVFDEEEVGCNYLLNRHVLEFVDGNHIITKYVGNTAGASTVLAYLICFLVTILLTLLIIYNNVNSSTSECANNGVYPSQRDVKAWK